MAIAEGRRLRHVLIPSLAKGAAVQTSVVRRLRCEVSACARRIFTERLEPAAPWARRTARLDSVAHQLGLALELVKRQMYGRGKLDLLQARVIASGA